MKKLLVISLALLFVAATVFAGTYAPTKLTISGPSAVQYDFDGKNLTLPVTLTGTPATVTFLVFTNGKAASIKTLQNGYLGWHYVNNIDTCLYVSTANQFSKGVNSLVWDGLNEDKKMVAAGDYAYYLWGFDNQSPPYKVSQSMTNEGCNKSLNIVQYAPDGKPLANPMIFKARSYEKWTVGDDPENGALKETTAVTSPVGGSSQMQMAIDPINRNSFYINVNTPATSLIQLIKFKWIPNGAAELQTDWAENGIATTSGSVSASNAEAGAMTDGIYLYAATGSHYTTVAEADLIMFDLNDGTVIKKFDISAWWSDVNAAAAGGQMNGGPNYFAERNGMIYLNCHCSCMKQMVDPIAGLNGTDEDFIKWCNGNGDYTLDHNFEADTIRSKWLCNDYNVGPYTYSLEADGLGFSIAPSFDMGAVSFGAMAPDGTGMSYFAYAGETASGKAGDFFICNGGSFDGIYTTNVATNWDFQGTWFYGEDSFKGVLTSKVAVKGDAPAAFAVAQNSPNPFNPTTTISFTLAKAGKTTVEVYNVAGQKIDTLVNSSLSAGSHSVVWNAAKFSAGVYFYTVKNGDFSKTIKMTLLK